MHPITPILARNPLSVQMVARKQSRLISENRIRARDAIGLVCLGLSDS